MMMRFLIKKTISFIHNLDDEPVQRPEEILRALIYHPIIDFYPRSASCVLSLSADSL